MKYKARKKEAETLLEEIKSLIATTPSPDLPGMIELATLDTDGVNRFESSRYIYYARVMERIEIEFDDGTEILVHWINGSYTIDIIPNCITDPEKFNN